jgi:DNA-binding NtrC family response regulator
MIRNDEPVAILPMPRGHRARLTSSQLAAKNVRIPQVLVPHRDASDQGRRPSTTPIREVPLDRTPLPDTRELPATKEVDDKQRWLEVLGQTGGNQTAAAKLLGMGRTAFGNRLNVYGIARRRKK